MGDTGLFCGCCRIPGGADPAQSEMAARADEDKTLFHDLLRELLRGTEKSIKVRGVIMCVLGTLFSQYAAIIGEWQDKSLGGSFKKAFLDYLHLKLEELVTKVLKHFGGCAPPRVSRFVVYVFGV
jgi:hypothetical protein